MNIDNAKKLLDMSQKVDLQDGLKRTWRLVFKK